MLDRPIPPSLTEPYHDDPPSRISHAMGGREFFFEAEARALHRIGIFLGLGWRLPKYVQRPDGIDMVKILQKSHGPSMPPSLTIEFLHCGDRPPEEAEPVRVINHVPYNGLRRTYEEALA